MLWSRTGPQLTVAAQATAMSVFCAKPLHKILFQSSKVELDLLLCLQVHSFTERYRRSISSEDCYNGADFVLQAGNSLTVTPLTAAALSGLEVCLCCVILHRTAYLDQGYFQQFRYTVKCL